MTSSTAAPAAAATTVAASNSGNKPNFVRVLEDASSGKAFWDFLHERHCGENLAFWLEVEEYRRLDNRSESQRERSLQIIRKYFEHGSSYEINIDDDVRQRVTGRVLHGEVTQDTFNIAQEVVFQLLEFDCYPKFVRAEPTKRPSGRRDGPLSASSSFSSSSSSSASATATAHTTSTTQKEQSPTTTPETSRKLGVFEKMRSVLKKNDKNPPILSSPPSPRQVDRPAPLERTDSLMMLENWQRLQQQQQQPQHPVAAAAAAAAAPSVTVTSAPHTAPSYPLPLPPPTSNQSHKRVSADPAPAVGK